VNPLTLGQRTPLNYIIFFCFVMLIKYHLHTSIDINPRFWIEPQWMVKFYSKDLTLLHAHNWIQIYNPVLSRKRSLTISLKWS